MKSFFFSLALLLSALVATAQSAGRSSLSGTLEGGIKGGGTFTTGFTNVPSYAVGNTGVSVPELNNRGNGVGIGYSGGVWVRKNFRSVFVQVEATYNRFVLKQKTQFSVDVNANPALVTAIPFSVQNGLLTATLAAETESTLESINVPVLVGKRWLGGRLRGYVGPNLIFVRKAELRRTASGVINASPTGFPETPIPATTGTTNLLNRYEAQNLEVKDFTYAAELGLGFSPLPLLDIDLRYAVPVGGVYRDSNITGFLGIATVSVGLKIF